MQQLAFLIEAEHSMIIVTPNKMAKIALLVNNHYKGLFKIDPEMEQNSEFNFAQEPPKADLEFKKQRAAYLAQRNARKKQAQVLMRKEKGLDSSSDSEQEARKKQPAVVPKFAEQHEDNKTNSSIHISSKQIQTKFQQEREKYKAERLAHRRELVKNKLTEFGPSSSSDDDSVPTYKGKINIVQAQKVQQQPDARKYSKQELDSNSLSSIDLSSPVKLKPNTLQPYAKLKSLPAQRKSYKQRYEIEVQSKKGTNIWVQQFLQIKENSVQIAQRSLPLYDITKTKLFFSKTQSGCLKMKVTYKDDEDIYFAVNPKQINEYFLDHYYYIFAKIISLKLQLMGRKQNTQTKAKLGLSQQQLKGAQITGKVRKSSFFGGWEQKIGVINSSGLCIFKQGKDKPVMVIEYNSIQQLWTRFDFDNENLIVKFLHNRSKVELSIPYDNFLGRENFLYHIYNLAAK